MKLQKTIQIFILSILLPLALLTAQFTYSGQVNPSGMFRLSDQSEISLPFRLMEINAGYTLGNFDIITNTAVEYRWSTGDYDADIREAYVVWYPDWGEVKLGKQIHAWGAADGNNPTDNLNPYDYYYMFLPGTDRKVATTSASVKFYWNNWQLESVFIPEHEPNRLPFGEEDFPINIAMEPENYDPVDRDYEFGFRLQTSVWESDVSFSWFSGNDRAFSLLRMNMLVDENGIPVGDMYFGFRKTDVIGMDAVSFIGDLTFRGEVAYFMTETQFTEDLFQKLPVEAEYAQYVLQAEYADPWDIQWSGQLIGNKVMGTEGLIFDPTHPTKTAELTEENFHSGMGTPFAILTDLGVMLSATATVFDGRLEIQANTFADLEESGFMVSGQATYSPLEGVDIECDISQFLGEEGTHFNDMEDFSHIRLGLKYSF